ncbi:MAG: V-type ATP synthase subunit I [Thermoproteota archaeon]
MTCEEDSLSFMETLIPTRMQKLRGLILDEFVDDVLRVLQAKRKVHLVDIKKSLPRWENLLQPYEAKQEVRWWKGVLNRVKDLLGDLGLKEELGILDQLFKPRERPPVEVSLNEERELLGNAEELIATVEKEVEENIKKFQVVRQLLWELRTMKIDVGNLRSTERLYFKLGKMSKDEIPRLENELKSRVRYTSVYTGGKKRLKFLIVVSLSKFSEGIEDILAKYAFQEVSLPKEASGSPSQCLRFLDSKANTFLQKYESRILCLHDAVVAKIERLKNQEKLGQMGRVFVLEGWVPEEDKGDIKEVIREVAEGHATVLVSPPDEPGSEIPTYLKDGKIIGRFRMLTEMYGMPVYNEIDPTPFLAVFFIFFVGLMSADVAIGTTLIVTSFFIHRGAGTRSEKMEDLSVILFFLGISTIFFGILMGELMGGMIRLPVLWMSAADNPIDFLFIVIGIGLVHLIFGAILGIFNNLYQKEYRKMMGDPISSLLLIGAVVPFLLTGQFAFEGVTLVGYGMGIAGLAALLAGKGLTGLLELTRLLSSVISYVRILALNMATTWMSRTFVLLGGLIVGVYAVGPLLNGILLLFSHFFIVFISIFATFAHSLRLHYVEFFGRFFIGGGTKFSPLASERAYTTLGVSPNKKQETAE